MARINYEKEWARIVTNLERTEIRILKELEMSGADDERADAAGKLEQVRAQLAQARAQLATLSERRRQREG
jgi:hypothetical protein